MLSVEDKPKYANTFAIIAVILGLISVGLVIAYWIGLIHT